MMASSRHPELSAWRNEVEQVSRSPEQSLREMSPRGAYLGRSPRGAGAKTDLHEPIACGWMEQRRGIWQVMQLGLNRRVPHQDL
jgi:hypothetical protein